MKNIVVGIDFSENSINSMRHAVAISLKNNATIHLVWVKTIGSSRVAQVADVTNYTAKMNDCLVDLVAQCRQESPKSQIQSVILEGRPFIEIPKYAANLRESIIVIGTHGNSGFEERIIGSNAMKTIAASTVPVLVLREGVEINRDLTQILLPIDTSFETLQKVKPAITFAKYFNAKINIIGIYPSYNTEDKQVVKVQSKHAATLCFQENVRHDIKILEYHHSGCRTIVEHALKGDDNLIVVMRNEEDTSGLFMGSDLQKLLTIAPMPVLIVPNVNYFSITK
jgi:nucleotide-binding universal stress UspA family protein